MKINKIFIGGLAMLTLTACNDYLDVEPATNAATVDFVFSTEAETNTALNGVYAKILTDATFGNDLYNTFMLNSDVDFSANANETAQGNQPRRFDVRSDASNVEKLWNNLYSGVETANEFIYNLKNSDIYEEGTEIESVVGDNGIENKEVPAVTNLTQMMGEAKVMRAMFYHELLSYWGDIPFTLEATFETDNLVPPITNRQEVSDALIKDLQEAAEYMKSDQDATLNAPERISKEAAYAMIARLALQAGGYSLNHAEGNTTQYYMSRPSDYQKYYRIAREYAKKVIDAGGHALTKDYRDVFIDECNFIPTPGDDPIFEIPFAQGSTSCWGYAQGPSSGIDTSVETDYSNAQWGTTKGGVLLSYFYRLQFEEGDLRRDYTCGQWYYGNQGQPTMRYDYAMHNNKWSKLWNTGGFAKTSTSATGINFAYIRYADVLLMFAEADNELNGPTADAIDAVEQVRNRAFGGVNYQLTADATSSKENFLKAILKERKFEFAGENMRWKDLVRNNMYAETLFYTFLTFYTVAEDMGGNANYMDMVEEHDGIEYSQKYSTDVFWTYTKNYNDPNFPNKSLYTAYVVNPYGQGEKPSAAPAAYFTAQGLDITPVSLKDITGLESSSTTIGWNTASIAWWDDNVGVPKGQVLYSLYGFIRGSETAGVFYVVNNGATVNFTVDADNPDATVRNLPAVRYLMPIPEEAIARSGGAYKNYYAY
ncbi:MAG: RagB/SusD family nutrient uptake outer membrane protein [Prevotella sp.]|nr:RagB/SusD family nutrient uptake outer membrane protein [Prevotella sp.]